MNLHMCHMTFLNCSLYIVPMLHNTGSMELNSRKEEHLNKASGGDLVSPVAACASHMLWC